jgi:polar amino acid transport system substrate-binding protein
MFRMSIVPIAFACLCVAAAAQPARADQLDDVLQRKELRCGTFADVPPFAAPDPATREMVGFDVDMCRALAKRLGVTASITPLSVEARVPEVQMGRVDVTVANLAYTTSRASQIDFSDSYYVAKEMLAVRASNSAASPADLRGRRISAAKGSTSELSITLNGSEPVTFQDTGSAYMALQQNKVVGMVANTMTITKLVNQSQTSGVPLRMVAQPMLLEPVAIGMRKGEQRLRDRINEALYAMDRDGEIDVMWNRWLGPNTEYKLTRDEHVQPIASIHFTPIP